MITDAPIPPEAHSLCWVCTHYEIEIIIGIKNERPKIDHICKKNQQASDDVWVCQKFKRKQKKIVSRWKFVSTLYNFFSWRPQRTRTKNNTGDI